ncbi:hypothetical protein QTH13_13390 [Clostridium perfringens]|nr:hypothetical protein [Clostridium perfringens]
MGNFEKIKKFLSDGNEILSLPDKIELKKCIKNLNNELIEAKEEIKRLKELLNDKITLKRNINGYFEDEKGIKYCSRCWEVDTKKVSLKNEIRSMREVLVCPNCKDKTTIANKRKSIF